MTRAYRHFEDFHVGDVIDLGKKTVSRQEIVAFAGEYDAQPMHLDDRAGAASLLGSLSASGWHTCAMTWRLFVDALLGEAFSLGTLGVERHGWRRPVRPGDVLGATARLLAARPSKSRPGIGLLTFEIVTINQDGERVMQMEPTVMVRMKGEPA